MYHTVYCSEIQQSEAAYKVLIDQGHFHVEADIGLKLKE